MFKLLLKLFKFVKKNVVFSSEYSLTIKFQSLEMLYTADLLGEALRHDFVKVLLYYCNTNEIK